MFSFVTKLYNYASQMKKFSALWISRLSPVNVVVREKYRRPDFLSWLWLISSGSHTGSFSLSVWRSPHHTKVLWQFWPLALVQKWRPATSGSTKTENFRTRIYSKFSAVPSWSVCTHLKSSADLIDKSDWLREQQKFEASRQFIWMEKLIIKKVILTQCHNLIYGRSFLMISR